MMHYNVNTVCVPNFNDGWHVPPKINLLRHQYIILSILLGTLHTHTHTIWSKLGTFICLDPLAINICKPIITSQHRLSLPGQDKHTGLLCALIHPLIRRTKQNDQLGSRGNRLIYRHDCISFYTRTKVCYELSYLFPPRPVWVTIIVGDFLAWHNVSYGKEAKVRLAVHWNLAHFAFRILLLIINQSA